MNYQPALNVVNIFDTIDTNLFFKEVNIIKDDGLNQSHFALNS